MGWTRLFSHKKDLKPQTLLLFHDNLARLERETHLNTIVRLWWSCSARQNLNASSQWIHLHFGSDLQTAAVFSVALTVQSAFQLSIISQTERGSRKHICCIKSNHLHRLGRKATGLIVRIGKGGKNNSLSLSFHLTPSSNLSHWNQNQWGAQQAFKVMLNPLETGHRRLFCTGGRAFILFVLTKVCYQNWL